VGADGLTGARVPCHRDAGPYNWRVDDDGAVRLVDWEHARADHPAVDLAAVVGLAHPDDPHVRAFLDGYGATPEQEAWLPAAVSLRALGAIGWARRRRDAAWEADGWAMLRRWTVGS
jgi:thiamine kinase-like enzyme